MTDQGLDFFVIVISDYIPEFVSFVAGFASLGLFFGLLGYVFHQTAPETLTNPPMHYRDYWSNIHSLGKSQKREYPEIDRRFTSSSLKVKGIWNRIVSGIKLPTPDVAFVLNKKQQKGDLYDLSSGKILGTNLVNPTELVSKYRPFILKVPEYSTQTKGVRRVVFEKLLENFLGKLVKTKVILPFFGVLSAVFLLVVLIMQGASPILNVANNLPVVIAVCFCFVTLILVWRWSLRSKELFKKRPDERILILIVYVVLALLFGFFYEMIFNFPTDTAAWVEAWFVWTRWFLFLTFVLGLGYMFIHREAEVVNTYFYDNTGTKSQIALNPVYKDALDEPFWIKNQPTKSYWVIRFIYYWRYELAKVPHSDWERIELWVDAETGILKWVVSDYHYRELWYEVKTDISSLYISFFLNFHTPIPILDEQEIQAIQKALTKNNKDLLLTLITGKSEEIIENIKLLFDKEFWQKLHPPKWISNFGLKNVTADFSSKIPWRFWRYPHGLETPEKYMNRPAAVLEDEPKNPSANK